MTDTASINISTLLQPEGPTCLIVKARFEPLGEQDRFQPAGFPEMGHVIYDAPRADEEGNALASEKVCIVDSAASMANHLETLCFANPTAGIIHPDLANLPYVRCVTDPAAGSTVRRPVVSTLTEGHRLASDYFLDAQLDGSKFRERLRNEFGIIEIKKDKTYFITPENWWNIYRIVFRYDPNSLVHGILFAKEQIKISRLLTAHLEAFGAGRVGSAGVKFDRLGKTNSGQPIFSKDEETARRIEATFLIDLGLIRSYGHGEEGLLQTQKDLLLQFALWKIERMLASPFRFRSGCHLRNVAVTYATENVLRGESIPAANLKSNLPAALKTCGFGSTSVTDVYYPSATLFQAQGAAAGEEEEGGSDDDGDEIEDDEN